jgi:hypothetical protein
LTDSLGFHGITKEEEREREREEKFPCSSRAGQGRTCMALYFVIVSSIRKRRAQIMDNRQKGK